MSFVIHRFYIILKTDELEVFAWMKDENIDMYEYESDKPDRLLNPIKNILDKNLYLTDDELQASSLLFIEWAYKEDINDRFQKIHNNNLKQDKVLYDFRKVVYKKYEEQKKKYLK